MPRFVSVLVFTTTTLFALSFAAEFTYYDNKGTGSCGTEIDASSQLLAAVSGTLWTALNPNNDPLCKQCVEVSYKGKTIKVPIKDKCPTCNKDQVDLSLPAFLKLENKAVGRAFGASYKIVSCSGSAPAPAPPASGGCKKTYTVKQGDSCWKVWTDNKLTEAKFRSLNPKVNCDALQIGAKVCIGN
ncbi:speract/scavenger receptor domain-containing protein [Aphelenchoides avenae]|nr:speract/scavenger receptor domain-containing protein [Aphelenchus avenae]